jgi:flavin reductase (DIM6/NTAB) family NADH-FMN oxidoreductase RutF
MKITKTSIEEWDQNYRRSFINSLAGFRQVAMIGTYDKNGISNLAIFNSLIHLGANPALFGLISRPDSVPRDTLTNIMDTGEFSINYVKAEHVYKAHQTSARYAKGMSEFDAVGFTVQKTAPYHVPFIKDAVVKIAMRFEKIMNIELNETKLIIGSIQYIEIDKTLVGSDGMVDLCIADSLISCGLDAYYSSQPIARLTYAKPGSWPTEIK